MSPAAKTSLDGFHNTASAQRADELARAFFDAVNEKDSSRIDELLARAFLSYDVHGRRSRTALKSHHEELQKSFSDLRFDVHENVGVLVEGDLVALRTIITGTHSGEFAGVGATGSAFQTSASHVLRIRDDRIVEHWPVLDSYRILVSIGAIPGVASMFQQMLGVPESANGLFEERLGTEFGAGAGRRISSEESRAISRRAYDGVISTGRAEDVDAIAENYVQNTGWTPDGRSMFANAWAVGRGAMPDGRPVQTHVVAENNRVASISVWDGTIAESGRQVDFTSADFFRVKDGLAAEHWDTVDYVRLYQSFGLLPDDLNDV